MQPDTITLSVNESGDDTTMVSTAFVRDMELVNKTVYVGPSDQPDSRQTLSLYRTEAKRNGNSRGSRKSAVKYVRELGISGADSSTITLPLIVEVSASMPLGTSEEDVTKALQTMEACFKHATLVPTLVRNLSI